MHDGVLYSIAPLERCLRGGRTQRQELWRSDPEVDQGIWQSRICCGVVNRGIALYKDMVIAPVVDGRMRALDAKTGRCSGRRASRPRTCHTRSPWRRA